MAIKEMIEVMQAYDRGEQIEYRLKDFMRDDEWSLSTVPPDWDWRTTDYRIKPQSQYRPYKNAQEFLTAQKEHGMYVKLKDTGSFVYESPIGVNNACISLTKIGMNDVLRTYSIAYKKLLSDYLWQDKTPCGVRV